MDSQVPEALGRKPDRTEQELRPTVPQTERPRSSTLSGTIGEHAQQAAPERQRTPLHEAWSPRALRRARPRSVGRRPETKSHFRVLAGCTFRPRMQTCVAPTYRPINLSDMQHELP